MRIIAGRFRGRRLQGPRGRELRPTSDRLRESLFNILGAGIRDAVVLDGFAGTGAVGLEALSRGAREAVFLESSREAAQLIRRNAGLCGVAGGFRVMEGNIFTSLRHLARSGFAATFAFFDPPYRWGPYGDLLATVARAGIAATGSPVVLEHHFRAPVPESGPGFRRLRLVRQGDKCLGFYVMEGGPPPDPADP